MPMSASSLLGLQMLSTRNLQQWKERHHAHFEIGGAPDTARIAAAGFTLPVKSRVGAGAREVRVYAPPPFSTTIQHGGDVGAAGDDAGGGGGGGGRERKSVL